MPKIAMTYRDNLHPWCIVRCLPNAQSVIIARFRLRNNAEAMLRLLKNANPHLTHIIVFDVPPKTNPSQSELEA